jgi:hypothetical protein
MKRLSKDQKQQRADLVTRLNDAEGLDVAALDAIDEIDEPELALANELESIRSQPE